jgi:hypothetical protein
MNKMMHTYNLATNNCEHLAFECLTGFRICTQLENSSGKRVVAEVWNMMRTWVIAHRNRNN